MGSKVTPATAFILLNLLFATMVSSTYVPYRPPLPPPSKPSPPPCQDFPPEPMWPQPQCPVDGLRLRACANLLEGLLNIVIGIPPRAPCCRLIQGLVDVEASVCLCAALRVKALSLGISLRLAVRLVLNFCGKDVPYGFQCPAA